MKISVNGSTKKARKSAHVGKRVCGECSKKKNEE